MTRNEYSPAEIQRARRGMDCFFYFLFGSGFCLMAYHLVHWLFF